MDSAQGQGFALFFEDLSQYVCEKISETNPPLTKCPSVDAERNRHRKKNIYVHTMISRDVVIPVNDILYSLLSNSILKALFVSCIKFAYNLEIGNMS